MDTGGSATERHDHELVKVYRALGEPTRLQILRLLVTQEELSCGEIARRLHLTLSTLSHHLGLLQECGLVEGRREGTFHLFRVRRDTLAHYAPTLS